MWTTLLTFIAALMKGEVFRIWREHKLWEATNAENEIDSLSDSELDRRMREITRKR